MVTEVSSKDFKAMVKNHLIKQSFVIIYLDSKKLYRYFRSNDNECKYYESEWLLVDDKLIRHNRCITLEEFTKAYKIYTGQCICNRENPQYIRERVNECRICQIGLPQEHVPMVQRKWYKVAADTMIFQSKDSRIII